VPVRESLVNGDIPNSLHCNYSLPVGRGVHPESHDMASPRQPSEPYVLYKIIVMVLHFHMLIKI